MAGPRSSRTPDRSIRWRWWFRLPRGMLGRHGASTSLRGVPPWNERYREMPACGKPLLRRVKGAWALSFSSRRPTSSIPGSGSTTGGAEQPHEAPPPLPHAGSPVKALETGVRVAAAGAGVVALGFAALVLLSLGDASPYLPSGTTPLGRMLVDGVTAVLVCGVGVRCLRGGLTGRGPLIGPVLEQIQTTREEARQRGLEGLRVQREAAAALRAGRQGPVLEPVGFEGSGRGMAGSPEAGPEDDGEEGKAGREVSS
jgi:hypothetical protein